MFVLGVLVGFVLAALVLAVAIDRRVAWLAGYEFKLQPPDVPQAILGRIRTAEAEFYAARPLWRRLAEELQDGLAIAAPELVYRLNLSVGRYRIKALTVDALLAWAVDNGYLSVSDATKQRSHAAIAYFAMQPTLDAFEAALYVAWLRSTHPGLVALDWAAIERDDRLIAKLYSGYMGAGGDMDGWRATLEPGHEALRRLRLAD